jgi:outer membrane immunogenic protein
LEMKRSLLASVSVLALSFGAMAADLPPRTAPTYKAPIAPAWSWTGFYLGINGGGVWHRAKAHTSDDLPSNDFSSLNSSGGTFGGQVGVNWQVQQLVLGVEADWNWVDAGGSANFVVFPGSGLFSSKLSSLATVRGRLGFAVAPATMIYGTGGFAAGRVNNQASNMGRFPDDRQTKSGWAAGGGIEHMFTPNWTAKAEALYVDLGRSTVQGILGPGYVGRYNNTAVVARAGLNYKW